MNLLIELLNRWGEQLPAFGWAMLWQSSLLILIVFCVDIFLRRHVRASVRYWLWIVVLAKLVLPPTLALPGSPAWWIRSARQVPAPSTSVQYFVSQPVKTGASVQTRFPGQLLQPGLSAPALVLLGWATVGVVLFGWMLFRWWQIAGRIRRAATAPEWLNDLLARTQRQGGLRGKVRLKLVDQTVSPAVCGLFRLVVLLPGQLADQLSPAQLRAVLLHELVHIRRGDVWVNCLQALLQILYWWHPLLWLANARIRRVREEAVDDAVMSALAGEAEVYVPTLVEVAKLAFQRPLMSLGLVGILESRSALRQRVQRLVNYQSPRKAGLTLLSVMGVALFAAAAVPMGSAPVVTESSPLSDGTAGLGTNQSLVADQSQVQVSAEFIQVRRGESEKVRQRILERCGWLLADGVVLVTNRYKGRSSSAFGGCRHISAPSLNTLSGRGAEIQAKSRYLNHPDSPGNFWTNQTPDFDFGQTLAVLPTVEPDGTNVALSLTPTVTEFLGFEGPENLQNAPRLRSHTQTAHVVVPDKYQVILNNLAATEFLKMPDGTTRNVPLQDATYDYMVVVTPVIVNATGRPVHEEKISAEAQQSVQTTTDQPPQNRSPANAAAP